MRFKRVDKFEEHYELLAKLGSGSYSQVVAGRHRRSGLQCAVKLVEKKDIRGNELHTILNRNEFEVLEVTQHPHITRIFDLLEDCQRYYIVAELVRGGDLLERLIKFPNRRMPEHLAACIIK